MAQDDFFSSLGKDIDSQLEQLRRDIGTYTDDNQNDTVFCPECGTAFPMGTRFCGNCGAPILLDEDDSKVEVDGIIMTDTAVLAGKYGIDRESVRSVLADYVYKCADMDITWVLLDMADHSSELGEYTWMDYSDVLQSYIDSNDIKQGPSLSLFIIGGNDVIPQPAEQNLCGDPEDEYQDTVFADFYYCFHGRLPLDFMDFNRARCNVARLPLESVGLDSTFSNDVEAYLDRCLEVMEEGAINISGAEMISNIDWVPASREMSRNLPIEHHDNVDGYTLDNMYLSPDVMAEMEDDELHDDYLARLSNAEMLVFNLHGACSPECNGFYSTGLAFSIDNLDDIGARVFNTVACWGARYIRYERKDSMLLSAMHEHGVMLYCGACVPALGKCGNFNYDGNWRIQPAAYSESFMARFCEYQCIGTMKAGEALLKAKCDYYNTSRNIEEDQYTLGTVLMFNLYGNPLLATYVDEDYICSIQPMDGSKEFRKAYSPTLRHTVVKKSASAGPSKSLLEDVRSSVDANLREISRIVEETLYRELGLESGELRSIDKYSTGIDRGYIFNYRKDIMGIGSDYHIKVDSKGRILDAIQTK